MTTKTNVTTKAASSWEQATLFINDNKVEWGAELVLLRGQVNTVRVEAPVELAERLNLGLAEHGDLNILASPDFGDCVARVDGDFNWKITPDAGRSGRITLAFFSREVVVPWEHRSLVISSNLADEADLKIDDKATSDSGTAFLRENRRNVKLVPKPNSPLAGLAFIMRYEILSTLLPGAVESVPAIGAETLNLQWDVGCITAGDGAFRLELYCPKLGSSVFIECKQIDVRYYLAGKYVEMIGGVGEATIGKSQEIFVVYSSPEMLGDTVKVEGGGFLSVKPNLPATFIVDPSMSWRMDVQKNIYSWSSEFLFKFSGVGDHVDVVNVHINESANQV